MQDDCRRYHSAHKGHENEESEGRHLHIESPTKPTGQVKGICERVEISPMPYMMKRTVGVRYSNQKKKAKIIKGL